MGGVDQFQVETKSTEPSRAADGLAEQLPRETLTGAQWR
jgi:hypothetical protein